MSIHKSILPCNFHIYKMFHSLLLQWSCQGDWKVVCCYFGAAHKERKTLLNYFKSKHRDPTAPGKDVEVLGNQPHLNLL